MNTSGHLMISLLVCLTALHGIHGEIKFTGTTPVNPTVSEDAAVGTSVFTQEAETTGTVAGGGLATISFSLVGTSNEFAVSSEGAVTVQAVDSLDYETTTEYVIVIQAVDNAETDPNTATTTVTIVVTDVNDNNPSFGSEPPPAQSICTTATSGTIGTYTATDADGTPTNNNITYSIIAGDDLGTGPNATKFNMNPLTAIITKTSTPFQSKTVYNLVLQAINTAPPNPSATTNLTISVTDAACSKASILSGGLVAMATILISALLKLSL